MHKKNYIYILLIIIVSYFIWSFKQKEFETEYIPIQKLRNLYSSGNINKWPKPYIDSIVTSDFIEIGNLPEIKFPKENPYSIEKVALGKKLFFDPRLSRSKQISCASCHEPQLGWGDGKRFSNGNARLEGKRNAQTIVNIGYAKHLFWDGRAKSLEDQIHFPVEDTLEMNTSKKIATENINNLIEYKTLFKNAFNTDKITFELIAKAIATYERTIVSGKTKFDQFIKGDSAIYTNEEVLGLHLFRTKAKCINCHYSPYFSDQKFHNLGLTYYGRKYEDLGLYNITKNKQDVGKFKTPTLREVTRTSPWMHNGLFNNLLGIMNIYNVGMPNQKRKSHQKNDSLFPEKSDLLHALNLTKNEKEAIIAFLKTLESNTSKRYVQVN